MPPPPAIRLVGGSNDAEGRVELFVDGQWTAICDEGWSLPDAAVACNHLGYSRSMRSSINSGMVHAYSECKMTKNPNDHPREVAVHTGPTVLYR